MGHMKNIDFRGVSNTGITARLKQALVLVATMLIGLVVSIFTNG